MKYKVYFDTLNSSSTPSLQDITIKYKNHSTSSYLISNPIDTNKKNTSYLTLS